MIETLVLPETFTQHQQYLERRMLQFWALRPSITDSSLTLSLELRVSSMASASFCKEHERNPSQSNRALPLQTHTLPSYFLCTRTHIHSSSQNKTEMVRGGGCREVAELKQRLTSSRPREIIRKADHPHLKKHYLEEQSASKLKKLSVHKLSVTGALLLSPTSPWTAVRTVTTDHAQLRPATAGLAILQGMFTPELFVSWALRKRNNEDPQTSSCATGSSRACVVPFITLEPDGQLKGRGQLEALLQFLELAVKHC